MIIKVIAGMQILFYKGRKNGVYTQDFQKDFEARHPFIASAACTEEHRRAMNL